jgi:fucose permease
MSSPSQQHLGTTRKTPVLLGGLLIGSAAVTFPACGNIFKDPASYALTNAQYGSLFVVQVLVAILSALSLPKLAMRLGTHAVLRFGLLSCASSMLLLALSAASVSSPKSAYAMLLLANAFAGFGIGSGISVLNLVAASTWKETPSRGVSALHAMLGAGLTLAPFSVSACFSLGYWWLSPLATSALLAVLAIRPHAEASSSLSGSVESHESRSIPQIIWVLAALAFLYGVAEATFSNWCVIYLHEDASLGIDTSGLALSAFWGMVTLGRLGYAAAANSRFANTCALAAPIVMALAFLIVSHASGSVEGIAVFALAGIGCSCFYPSLLADATSLAGPRDQFVSGLMVASVLGGTGAGTYLTAFWREFVGLSLGRIYGLSAVIPLAMLAGLILWRPHKSTI